MKRPTKTWGSHEVKLLKLIYVVSPWPKLLREFSPRSQESIRNKARELGLLKRPNRWRMIAELHGAVFRFPSKNRVPNTQKDDAEAA